MITGIRTSIANSFSNLPIRPLEFLSGFAARIRFCQARRIAHVKFSSVAEKADTQALVHFSVEMLPIHDNLQGGKTRD